MVPAVYRGKDFVREEVGERPNDYCPLPHRYPGVTGEGVMIWGPILREGEEHYAYKAEK